MCVEVDLGFFFLSEKVHLFFSLRGWLGLAICLVLPYSAVKSFVAALMEFFIGVFSCECVCIGVLVLFLGVALRGLLC